MYLLSIFKFCILINVLPIYNPEGLSELKEMNKKYSEAKSISMDVEIKIEYSDETNSLTSKGKMKKTENGYYSELMGKISIISTTEHLMIDKNNKYIIVSKPVSKNEIKIQAQQIPDTILDKYSFIKSKMENGIKLTSILNNNTLYEKIEIELNSNNYLTEYCYTYKKSDNHNLKKVTIKYSSIKINSEISDSGISGSEFVILDKNKVKTTEKYSSYQIIDNRNQR